MSLTGRVHLRYLCDIRTDTPTTAIQLHKMQLQKRVIYIKAYISNIKIK